MDADVETIRIEGSLLADLYARHADEALRLSYLLTGDGALAEDLVQDAFVRVAGRLLHLRDPGWVPRLPAEDHRQPRAVALPTPRRRTPVPGAADRGARDRSG